MKKLLILLMLLPTIVFGRKFYVSELGNDANSFSAAQNSATPWATMSKVQSSLGSFSSGDSILFARGSRFSGTLTIQSKTGLYFGAYGTGVDPLFWGTGSTIGVLVTLRACTNVTIYGWNISDTTISFTNRTTQAKIQTVFQLENSSTNNVFRKCRMDRIGYGAYFNEASNANTIDSCDIGNLRMIKNTPQSQNADDDYGGVPVQISSKDNIFTNNYLHDCYSVSYDYGYDGGGVEFFEEGDSINRNIIMYNTFYDCNGTFEFGSNNDGVANKPQVGNVIAYNKIINSSSFIYINNNGQYKTKVTNLKCYNNIYVQTVTSRTGDMNAIAMATGDATAGIVVLKNNIFQISNGAAVARSGQWTGSNLTHTNNIYKLSGGSVTNFTLTATETGTSGNTWVDTTNADPLYWNYNLLPSAAYAATGGTNVGLTRDFAGNVVGSIPSIGIYQHNTSTSSLRATSTYSPVLCNGGNSTVTVSATGGTPPYTGVGTFSKTAGAYGYTVTDATNATSTTTGSIPQPPAVSGTVNWTNGTATTITGTITAGGGTAPYTYSIRGTGIQVLNQGSSTFTGVPYGSGTITVTDANNCQSITPYTITNTGTPTSRTFYVSALGNDGNNGLTTNTPWRNVSKVQSSLSSFTSGDRILFRKGDRFGGTLTIQSKTGLYFGVYGEGADPLFWGTGSQIGVLVTLSSSSNITFYGWNITDTTIELNNRYTPAKIQTVFQLENNSRNNVFRKCTMNRIGYGAYFTVGSTTNTIDSCDIGNLRMIVNDSTNPDNDYGGVPVQFSSRDNIFTNNYLHDCWSISYDYGYDGGGVEFFEEGDTVKGNRIMYNTFYDCNGTFEFGSSPNGVAGNPQSDNVIAYNKIINSSSLIYINNSGQYRTKVTNLQIYNNVYVQTVASRTGDSYVLGMASEDQTAGIVVMKNNIFKVSNGASVASSGRFTGSNLNHTNNVYKLSGGSVTNFTLTNTETGTAGFMWTDTTSNDPLNWTYTLLPTAYAINRGANLGYTRDFAGLPVSSTPDIGILEYQASTITVLATATVGTISCYGGTTTVTVTATGGTAPYTGTGTFVRSAGPFSYTVTDATGATYTVTGNITQPTALVASASYPSVACNGGSTTVLISATGGTPPYIYTGSYTLPAGTYYDYAVDDANGCQAITPPFTITQPRALSVGVSTGVITTNGGTTTVTVLNSGGTGTITYSLDGGAYQSSNIFTGVLAGGHTVTIKDVLNCTSTRTFSISQPGPANTRSRLKFVNEQ
jgi:hypothetical protein